MFQNMTTNTVQAGSRVPLGEGCDLVLSLFILTSICFTASISIRFASILNCQMSCKTVSSQLWSHLWLHKFGYSFYRWRFWLGAQWTPQCHGNVLFDPFSPVSRMPLISTCLRTYTEASGSESLFADMFSSSKYWSSSIALEHSRSNIRTLWVLWCPQIWHLAVQWPSPCRLRLS